MLLSAAALGTVYASFSMLWGGGEEEIAPGDVNEDSDKSDTRLSAREETAFDRVARDVAKLNNLQLADITSSATFNEDGSLHHWDLRKKKIISSLSPLARLITSLETWGSARTNCANSLTPCAKCASAAISTCPST